MESSERRQSRRRSFSEEFKRDTVALVRSSYKTLAEIARDLDLTESSLRDWLNQAAVDADSRAGLTSSEREALARLRKESCAAKSSRTLSRRFLLGAGVGMAVLLLVLSGGSASLLQDASAGAMYDAQAHSLLDGRWDVSPAVAGIESFGFNGKSFLYFGPFPALLRMPLAVFTDRFDGRLGQVSILLAIALGIAAAALIVSEIARRLDGLAMPTAWARNLMTVLGLVVAGGSVITFIANRGDVYNEAIAWGLGTSLASIATLLRAIRVWSIRYVVMSGAFAAAALESRITLGVSAIAPIALVLAASSTMRSRQSFGISAFSTSRRLRIALSLATALPVLLFIGVQLAKFGTIIIRPSHHVWNVGRPQFQTYLERNGDTYFSPSFVPANFLNMTAWPSRMSLDSAFPWLRPVDLAVGPSPGDPEFLDRNWTGSLAFTQTLLFVLASIGVYKLFLARMIVKWRGHVTAASPVQVDKHLRLVVLGSLAGFAATSAYAYQYHRFIADAFPAVILLSVLGAAVLPGTIGPRWLRRTSVAVVAVLATWSIWVNVSTALLAQTERAWDPTRAAYSRLIVVRDAFGSPSEVVHFDLDQPITPPGQIGTLAEIGECDALLGAAGTEGFAPTWWPIESGPRFKRTLQIDTVSLPAGETVIAASADDSSSVAIAVVVASGNRYAEIVLRSGGTESRFPINHRSIQMTFEVSPIWAALTIRFGDETRSLPWQGHLEVDTSHPASVHDLGADDVSLCNAIAASD